MTTLAEHIIVAGDENRPPMLEKSMYDSWESRIRLFIKAQQLQDDCDVQATNIILHGLPPDVYALVNHQEAAKDIWDRVKMLMKGTELSYQERECRLYNLFDTFAHVPGETLKFVTDVKLAKHLYTTNYDQLYAYLSQHEQHANEVCISRERYPDPLAFVANSPTLYNPSQSPQHSGYSMKMPVKERSKVVSSKALDASLVVIECSGTKSDEHITSSSSGTYITHVVDADIRPVNESCPFVEVNSRAKVQSPKTRNINKPVEPKSHTQNLVGRLLKDKGFLPRSLPLCMRKQNTPRSCLRWKPTGRIFKIAGLRWIPTGKMFTDNTTKVDSEPPNGSNDDITNPLWECDQS
ncbi:hypothetical protein Tco_1144067 [Tanacetum coccineum]